MNLKKLIAVSVLSVVAPLSAAGAAELPLPFIRGDFDGSGEVDIGDPIFVLQYFFAAAEPPGCEDACDSNDDGRLSITDPIFLLRILFQAGQDVIIAPVITLLEETVKSLTAGLPQELQGLRVCAGE